MDINKRFDEILKKYGLIQYTDIEAVNNFFFKLSKDLPQNSKVGIYGLGVEVYPLFYYLKRYASDIKIDYCFDKSKKQIEYGDLVVNSDVYTIDRIKELGINYIILSSKIFRNDMISELETIGYKGKILDIYGMFEGFINDHYVDYKKIFNDKQEYKSNYNEKIHKTIIKDYLLSKDFFSALKYIDLYITKNYDDSEIYSQLKNEINSLLCDIQKYMDSREKKDIIINWVDAVSYYDIAEFPFLKQCTEDGVEFINSYTVMPWTTEMLKTIICGELPIEGKLFNRNDLCSEDSKIKEIMYRYDYSFVYCGIPRMSRFFSDSNWCEVPLYENRYTGSVYSQWNAIAKMCREDKPCCVLIHSFRESHEPFISGEGNTFNFYGSTPKDWENLACHKQAKSAGLYIDKQLDFYSKLYGKNTVRIYMSDHGRVGNSPLDEKKIHTMLTVIDNKGLKKKKNRLFSFVNFYKLIEYIISDKSDWDDLCSDYVFIQNLDAYDPVVVEDTLSGRLARHEMYQCRGVVTLQDSYYIYADGMEYYFKPAASDINAIDNVENKSRIKELKKICGTEFIDIYKYDKFKYSRLLYENKRSNYYFGN